MTKKKPSEKFCPHCKTWRDARGFGNHEKTCRKHPGRDWLIMEYSIKGHTLNRVAGDVPGGVSKDTLGRWLDAADIERHDGSKKVTPRAKKVPAVVVLAGVVKTNECGSCWALGFCVQLESWQPVFCEGVFDIEMIQCGGKPGRAPAGPCP